MLSLFGLHALYNHSLTPSGMGEGLLLDLIRSISPSHIIRLVGPSRHEVLPFTEDVLANRPGLLTWPSDLNLHLHGRHRCPPSSDFTVNDLGYSASPSVDIPEESFETMDVGRSETEMEVIEILDSDEGVAKMSMGNTSSLSNNRYERWIVCVCESQYLVV